MLALVSWNERRDSWGMQVLELIAFAMLVAALAGSGQETPAGSATSRGQPASAALPGAPSEGSASQGAAGLPPPSQPSTPDSSPIAQDEPSRTSARTSTAGIPRLLDLGAGKCIPCKKMAPILAELKTEYAGSMEVEFIDVWQNPQAARQYGIEAIPTQIFFDASGKELFRHEGFYSKEEILAKWKELGVSLTRTAESPSR